MKYSVSVIVSSDAHFCRSVGQFDEALAMLNSLNFPKQLVVNADMEQLESWFLRKRR